jgi:Spy/CpxP family protein refolding chaperone
MNRLKAWLIGGAIVTTAAFSLPIVLHADGDRYGRLAQRPGNYRMFGGGAPLISIALNHQNDLKLTADQVANLEKTKSDYQSRVAPIQQQLKSVEGEIAKLTQETPANLVQLQLKIQEAEKHRSDLRYLRIEALENGKSILTAEQREQLKTLLASRHGDHRGHRGQAS